MADNETRHVIIYFAQDNNANAKTFAARMRAENREISLKTTLVWANRFRSEADVLSVGAIIVQEDVEERDMIVSMYEAFSPETEIHYMTPEGEFSEDAESDTTPTFESAVQTEAETASTESTDDADQGSDPAEGGDNPFIGTVQHNDVAGSDAGESAAEHGSEGDAPKD